MADWMTNDDTRRMISIEAEDTFITKFRVGPYADAPRNVQRLWLWFMKDVCGKVGRTWSARVKCFRKNPLNDCVRSYLSTSDEAFAQLCVVLYYSAYDQPSSDDIKPKRGRKRGNDDLGTNVANDTYTTLFNFLHAFDKTPNVDALGWEKALMDDISGQKEDDDTNSTSDDFDSSISRVSGIGKKLQMIPV
jgi:hypothetical protein